MLSWYLVTLNWLNKLCLWPEIKINFYSVQNPKLQFLMSHFKRRFSKYFFKKQPAETLYFKKRLLS